MRTISIAVVAGFIAASAFAGSVSAPMYVSVQVIARTILDVEAQPTAVEITATDVARGFVEVPQAVAFQVRSNAPNGYRLTFDPVPYPFAAAEIVWGDKVAFVAGEETWLSHPYQRGRTFGVLTARLKLARSATPGTYPWPVRFAAESVPF